MIWHWEGQHESNVLAQMWLVERRRRREAGMELSKVEGEEEGAAKGRDEPSRECKTR